MSTILMPLAAISKVLLLRMDAIDFLQRALHMLHGAEKSEPLMPFS